MLSGAVKLIVKEWKLCISYLMVFLFLQIADIYLSTKFDYSLLIILLNIYIFYSFLNAFKLNLESKDKIDFFQSLKAIDKNNALNYLTLLISILFLYYLISLPVMLLELIKNGSLANAYGSDNLTVLNVIFETVFRSLYQIIICFSVSYLIFFKTDALQSMIKGFKIIPNIKPLIIFLIVLNFIINIVYMMSSNSVSDICLNEFIWPLIFPFCVIVLFTFYNESPSQNSQF